ncbi:MAG: tRNA threonylcarbamoyladenosine dehydratase [Gammaproteobacteria bacterium]|nr:tRNA threonylcarbamoyladenosine dehydratase [Gammaproteobacteria bacterium]MBU1602936.1 tRNA threonylcarbamoyladenosine dehydratase [Gammaproteobacteria bacterium]MBU2434788.1 tRNA threonylcarbamoyladenosine dehydratase [Gammaproteobacteria bacterium]MBU2448849.1 tRNA threonylcarbamoyladenosine dehydratase [Gammaproteobacteria bacterium]
MSIDRERRFGGVTRLYGVEGAERLRSANVCVVGIGGVGSWSVEALARTGVGQITVVDLDMVAESNTNRQIHALGEIYGKSKVDAISERVLAINPDCKISTVEDFVTPENVKSVLNHDYSVVIDAIDQVRAKAAMLSFCHRINIPIVVAGAAGGKIDPTRISTADLSRTIQDPLLAKVRSILRREYGFPRDPKKKFNVSAVFSTEQLRYPDSSTACNTEKGSMGLNCTGFGSSVCVTAVFGMVAAAEAVKLIIRN